jgi:hypothetical protein
VPFSVPVGRFVLAESTGSGHLIDADLPRRQLAGVDVDPDRRTSARPGRFTCATPVTVDRRCASMVLRVLVDLRRAGSVSGRDRQEEHRASRPG